ncbi:hypothetical protein TNCV_2489831, partial [Trichonephila clavipes]
VHKQIAEEKKEKTFRCPGNQSSGGHLSQDCATTGVQKEI